MDMKGVLIDLGNTLVYGPRIYEVFERALDTCRRESILNAESNVKVLRGFRKAHQLTKPLRQKLKVEVSLDLLISIALREAGIDAAPRVVRELRERLIDGYAETRKVYPDSLKFLVGLKSLGYRRVVLSNSPSHSMVIRVLEKTGLRREVDVVVTSAQLGLRKPHPLTYLNALRRADIDRAICVGDNIEADVTGALSVGISAIHVFRGGVKLKLGVNSLEEVLRLLTFLDDSKL